MTRPGIEPATSRSQSGRSTTEPLCRFVSALNDYCTRWCKREHVESYALNNWKLKIFKIIDEHVLFYSNNLDILPPKP